MPGSSPPDGGIPVEEDGGSSEPAVRRQTGGLTSRTDLHPSWNRKHHSHYDVMETLSVSQVLFDGIQ